VFSGLATGIDTNAHLGALEGGGNTVAVLGTPIVRSYPRENETLQQRIAKVGTLVSQFAPGTATTRASFPIRNATMSGLALGTVVIEASETSGALIQARRCLEQNRKLFIPQSAIENKSISWPKKFEQRGAIVFRTIGELLAALELESLIPSAQQVDTVLAGVGGADAT
jgi:DNA processing protein